MKVEKWEIPCSMRYPKASWSIKPWMWNLATAPVWSDLIHVTLWRNYGFSHSFGNFSKSNAFGENFIRTKFILHKIFSRMSTLSRRKYHADIFQFMFEKIVKNHLWLDITILRGRGCLATKININLFCEKWGFEYFSYNNFFKKNKKRNNIFQNNRGK